MQQYSPNLFFAGAATAYFTINALNFLLKKDRTRLQTILGWILAVWAVLNLKDIITAFPAFQTKEWANNILFIDCWSTVTYIIFIFELSKPRWTTWRKVAALIAPFAVFTLIYAFWKNYYVLNSYIVFVWICAFTFFTIGFFLVKDYSQYIRNNYSNIDEIDISWLKSFYLFAILEQSLYFVLCINYNVFLAIAYYASAISMWQIAIHYSRLLRPIPMVEPSVSLNTEEEEENRTYTFAGTIEKLVEEKELYLNKDIMLSDLAKSVGTNRTYLSDYFCNVKHTTFYDYINQLRIEQKAIPLIQQHPEYTLEFIASESGFKSISTFRRAFSKFVGKSPSSYRSELENAGKC